MIRLRVWANARPMGWFGIDSTGHFFEYDPQWLDFEGGFVLSPWFPLSTERYSGDAVKVFFENLLPEGEALQDILAAIALQKAPPHEILGRLGRELPGVLSLLPENEQPNQQQQYRALEYAEMHQRILNRADRPLLLANAEATMSIAGAQDKIGLRFDPRTQSLSDCVGSSPSTHILKPDTRLKKFQPSAINEYACMRLAKALKLPTPDVWLLRVPEAAYVVKRYDREIVAGNIIGVHQVDGCQLLNVGPGWKYEKGAGLVSLEKISTALQACSISGADRLNFARWVMFNYLIGNSDAHAKNISILISDTGFRLAPFYDLLCVKAYGDHGLALFIGDEDTYEAVGLHSWEAFCDDCGFAPKRMVQELERLARALPKAWEKIRNELTHDEATTEAERALLGRMSQIFDEHASNVASMLGS